MADAVLHERFVTTVMPVAVLFLTVLGTVALIITGCALLAKAVDRYRRTDAKQAEFLATTIPDPYAPPAADDNRPASDPHLAARFAQVTAGFDDEDDDSTWTTGRDRHRTAIRDEQQKEAGDA